VTYRVSKELRRFINTREALQLGGVGGGKRSDLESRSDAVGHVLGGRSVQSLDESDEVPDGEWSTEGHVISRKRSIAGLEPHGRRM